MLAPRVVIGLALVASGCNKSSADPAAGAPPPAVVVPDVDVGLFSVDHPEQFPLVTAAERKTAPELLATGVVMADVQRNAPVVSLASGRVIAIHARVGDTVKRGLRGRSTRRRHRYRRFRQHRVLLRAQAQGGVAPGVPRGQGGADRRDEPRARPAARRDLELLAADRGQRRRDGERHQGSARGQAVRIRPPPARRQGPGDHGRDDRHPGVRDLKLFRNVGQPNLNFTIDRQIAARFGINVTDIQDATETAVGGKAVSAVLVGEQRYDVVVRYQEPYRDTREAIERILLVAPSGERVSLGQLTHVEVKDGANDIYREGNQRYVAVTFSVRERDLGSTVREAIARVNQRVVLPPGYHLQWAGEYENQQRSSARLLIVLPLTSW